MHLFTVPAEILNNFRFKYIQTLVSQFICVKSLNNCTCRSKQIERHCEELGSRDAHGFLTLLTHDLDKSLGFLRTVIPLTAVGSLHHWWALQRKVIITEWKPSQCTQQNKSDFDVLLTVHLSIFISVFNQLDAINLFHNKFYFMPLHVSSTCAHHQEVKIALHSLWYHHTYASTCFEHMCSKHVEAWNKTYCERNLVHHVG